VLQPGKSSYEAVDLTMGIYGFPFKEPGAYRIEASYTNLDGGTAVAVSRIYVRPAASYDTVPVVHDLFRADVGRVLLFEGTEVMDDVNDRLMNAEAKLEPNHPLAVHLRMTRYQPLAKKTAIVQADGTTRKTSYDPDEFVAQVGAKLVGDVVRAADTMGHIWFRDVVDQYTNAAVAARKPEKAYAAQNAMHALFVARGVVPDVLATIEKRVEELRKRMPVAKRPVLRVRA